MRLLFVVNPKSGRGRAASLARAFEPAVIAAGHSVRCATIGETPPIQWHTLFNEHEVCVVFGGDGTVHSLLPALMKEPAALYQVPTGTENLFARQFRMDRRPATLLAALEAGTITPTDLGEANGRPFAIMCSAGPDAAVVRRLAAGRTGAIRHSSYIAPILSEFFRPSLSPLTIEIDGAEVIRNQRGMLVIGNSPWYALGLNPARQADITDGLLDVVFLPATTSLSLARWACVLALGSPLRCRQVVFRRAHRLVVRTPAPMPYQLDGDEGGMTGNGAAELSVSILPRALRVLGAV